MEVKSVSSVIRTRLLSTHSLSVDLRVLYGQSSRWVPTYSNHVALLIFFCNWLNGVDNRFKRLIRVGALAVIWSLWLSRNDKVFNDKNSSLMQVIYRTTATLRLWSPLQRVEHRDLFTEVCTSLEGTARDFLSQHGWQHNLRIGPPPPWACLQFLILICNSSDRKSVV